MPKVTVKKKRPLYSSMFTHQFKATINTTLIDTDQSQFGTHRLIEGMIMRSAIVKRSIVIAGHKTSVTLEDEFWGVLKEIARSRKVTLSDLVGEIDTRRRQGNLSSAIRVFVLNHYRARIAASSTK